MAADFALALVQAALCAGEQELVLFLRNAAFRAAEFVEQLAFGFMQSAFQEELLLTAFPDLLQYCTLEKLSFL
jgi:hypothetical protein